MTSSSKKKTLLFHHIVPNPYFGKKEETLGKMFKLHFPMQMQDT